MRAAALAVDAAAVRDTPDSAGGARFTVHFARNSFGWGGNGSLVASRDGLSFNARRAGWLGYLRPRESVHVACRDIASVLREGHVVHLQFQRRADANAAHVEFVASDDQLATAIVGYLPTVHTVEIEKSPQSSARVGSRNPARWGAALAIVAGLAGVVLVWNRESVRQTSSVDARGDASPLLPSPPPVEAAEELAIPAPQLLASRGELRAAEERTAAMRRKFALDLRDLMDGKITQANFALRLNRDLIPQWQQERGELSGRFDRISSQLSVLDLLKRSSDLWARALTLYSEGLREQRPEKVLQAFAHIARAQALEGEAYDLVRRAETRSASAASGQP